MMVKADENPPPLPGLGTGSKGPLTENVKSYRGGGVARLRGQENRSESCNRTISVSEGNSSNERHRKHNKRWGRTAVGASAVDRGDKFHSRVQGDHDVMHM